MSDEEKKKLGRPSKNVVRTNVTLERDVLAWFKSEYGERGVSPVIQELMAAHQSRVQDEQILAEAKKSRVNQ